MYIRVGVRLPYERLCITSIKVHHPLIPALATPEIIYFCMMKNKISIGKITMEEAAINNSYLIPASVVNADSPTGNVRISCEFVTMSGHKKAFQLLITFNKAIVMSAGLARGTMIYHKNLKSLHPSTFAA